MLTPLLCLHRRLALSNTQKVGLLHHELLKVIVPASLVDNRSRLLLYLHLNLLADVLRLSLNVDHAQEQLLEELHSLVREEFDRLPAVQLVSVSRVPGNKRRRELLVAHGAISTLIETLEQQTNAVASGGNAESLKTKHELLDADVRVTAVREDVVGGRQRKVSLHAQVNLDGLDAVLDRKEWLEVVLHEEGELFLVVLLGVGDRWRRQVSQLIAGVERLSRVGEVLLVGGLERALCVLGLATNLCVRAGSRLENAPLVGFLQI